MRRKGVESGISDRKTNRQRIPQLSGDIIYNKLWRIWNQSGKHTLAEYFF